MGRGRHPPSSGLNDVRYWPKADMGSALHMSASDPSDCDAKCWLGLIYINGECRPRVLVLLRTHEEGLWYDHVTNARAIGYSHLRNFQIQKSHCRRPTAD